MSASTLYAIPDGRRQLRALLAAMEVEIGRLPKADPDSAETKLAGHFNELVALLALGVEPAMATCPACGRIGVLTATRCGHCWAKLKAPSTNPT